MQIDFQTDRLTLRKAPTMLPRFQHLLVPCELTRKTLPALEVAFEMAMQNHARVTLLHVIERLDVPEDREVSDFYRSLESRADTELEREAQRFRDAKIPVEWKVLIGRRAGEVAAYAADHQIDLVVVSSHPIDRQRPLESWGTLSYQIALLCDCPVLMVKEPSRAI